MTRTIASNSETVADIEVVPIQFGANPETLIIQQFDAGAESEDIVELTVSQAEELVESLNAWIATQKGK